MTESVLNDIGAYKDTLLEMLLSNDGICETLLGKGYSNDDKLDLIYSQVYPYLYVDETQTEVLSYICVEVDIPRVPTGTIKDMKLIVWAYSHKECMRYSYDSYCGTRADILSDMIDRQISDPEVCHTYGIGKPTLASVTYFFPQNKYYGRQMIYTIPDFKVKKVKEK